MSCIRRYHALQPGSEKVKNLSLATLNHDGQHMVGPRINPGGSFHKKFPG